MWLSDAPAAVVLAVILHPVLQEVGCVWRLKKDPGSSDNSLSTHLLPNFTCRFAV